MYFIVLNELSKYIHNLSIIIYAYKFFTKGKNEEIELT